MDFIVYNTSTGEIKRHGSCPDFDVASQALAGETVIQATYQPGTIVNGVLVPLTSAQVVDARYADLKAGIALVMAQRKAKQA